MAVPFTKIVHVDTAQPDENHEFQLSPNEQTAALGENFYKLKLLEHPLQEVSK